MSKLNSHCLLLLTLVFSSAHAPTFQFWRNPVSTEQAAIDVARTTRASFSAESMATLPREFAEEGELKRFHLDELYLPNLDVSLPELFDWSDLDRRYVADVDPFAHEVDLDPNSRGASMRIASMASSFPAAGSLSGASSESAVDSSPASETTSPHAGKGDSSSGTPSDTIPGDTSNIDDTTIVDDGDPISDTTPVPPNPLTPIGPDADPVSVPAPGAFGLFALGLAGLQLAGRKKKQKRLAAS